MLRKIYEKAEKLLANRLLALIILIVVLYCVLIGRVFVLQIVEGQSHKNDFTYKVQKTVKTSGTRGEWKTACIQQTCIYSEFPE